MIVISQGYEPEWLVVAESELLFRSEHFRHALHGTGWRLKGNFYKISIIKRSVQSDHSTGG